MHPLIGPPLGLLYSNHLIESFYLQPCFQTKAAAGTDFVRKTIESFLPATAKSVVLVDVMAYDGAPALAALEVARSSNLSLGVFGFVGNLVIVSCG